MKTLKRVIPIIITFVLFQSANAQSDKTQRTIGIVTQTIKVSGTCSMDKRRIETAAISVEGVKSAAWDEYSQILTLKYSVIKKDAPDAVQRKIAAAGNDTGKYKADNEAYQKLPDCCHYRKG